MQGQAHHALLHVRSPPKSMNLSAHVACKVLKGTSQGASHAL